MAQGTSSGTSSRRHGRNEHDTSSISSSRYADAEWEAKEALRQRELEEARARATQMEKTMRWWSDCTANWREKWSKVRNERNKAREESKMLRTKLESAFKEINAVKREKLEVEAQNDQLKKEMERIHLLLLKHAGQWDHELLEALESEDPEHDVSSKTVDIGSAVGSSSLQNVTELAANSLSADLFDLNESLQSRPEREHGDPLVIDKDSCIEEYILQGAVPRHAVEMYVAAKENAVDRDVDGLDHVSRSDLGLDVSSELTQNLNKTEITLGFQCKTNDDTLPMNRQFSQQADSDLPSPDKEHLLQKLSMLQLRLDEASKTVQAERDEKILLHRGLEKMQVEVQELKDRCEDLRASKQEVVRELLLLQDQHQDQVRLIQLDLQDEATSREGMDRRLADLRTELERLQAENAAEWGKRERLETEKLGLERDNKKLRAEVRDMQERLEKKGRPLSTTDTDVRQLQQDLADRNKELSDLRHSHGKLKKVLQDKSTELAHAVRRAEQYEAEVKRLRGRVEELKRELAVAEDEVDSASNNIRKLQRTNDELQEQVESLQVQVEHLHTRVRISSSSTLLSHRGQTLLGEEASDDDINEY
ncbi:Coiled-coil domain-containing protein 102A [Cryptotermes secundus]|uniref:Coiled-coil domain-containing protein 102A n=2 Tax=Cryptotermes secundus TaxID=105785 RepID=A0A2J7QGC4_9NEOP|nr:coiled-coil domain-containing protein 102A isoform X2 [Cryptotermes secundus]PNF27632.1 Coiled-coil domain-containing protein 102A [Cryptotermes secundus]